MSTEIEVMRLPHRIFAPNKQSVGVLLERAKTSPETPWQESGLLSPGAGAGRLDFDKPYMPDNLEWSRNTVIKGLGITIGEEIATNVSSILGLQEGDVVADLGVGPGLIAKHILPSVGETGWVYGIDASVAMLKRAHANLFGSNSSLIHGDIHVVDRFLGEKVDAAILSGNLHLLSNRHLAFRAIWNILKDGGKLAVVSHVTRYKREDGQNSYSKLIDDLSQRRPDMLPEGLRMPTLAESELHRIMKVIRQAGFTVSEIEDQTWAPDVDQVLGKDPVPGVIKRLELIKPGTQRRILEQEAHLYLSELFRGRQTQVYLLCQKKTDYRFT